MAKKSNKGETSDKKQGQNASDNFIPKSKLDKEIKKIWLKLIDTPERGIVRTSKEYDPAGKKAPTAVYDPSLYDFTLQAHEKIVPWATESWPVQISNLKRLYGLGPSVSSADTNRDYDYKNMGNKQFWWQREKAHLSDDRKYYVVPLVFENMNQNAHLVGYKSATVGGVHLYKIGSPQEAGTLLAEPPAGTTLDPGATPPFNWLCKKLALKKLQKDLAKAMSDQQIEDWHAQFGIIPSDKMVPRANNQKTNQPDMVTITQSWHIVPRKPDYQNLWIKVLFDRDWVDSLPPKTDPNIDYSITNREVLILVKDLKNYLDNLRTILLHFDAQMKLAWSKNGIETSFNASCIVGTVAQIYDKLDGLMRTNGKDSLDNLKDTNGALQFGFTKDYTLQYIAFSEVADCLCEEDVNMNAYTLREGLESLKGVGPFTNNTINNFIHKLPDINRRYSKFLKGLDNPSKDLFGTEQSYMSFVNTYVYPPPATNYVGGGETSDFERGWMTTMAVMDEINNPFYKDLLFTGKYVKDPLQIMSPDVKNLISGVSNVSYMYQGDDGMMKSLVDEMKSLTSLYDKLLNKIPISELIKVAAKLIFKCLLPQDLKRHLCKIILKTIPIAEIRMMLYPCLRNLGTEGELAIAKLEEMVTGRTGEVYKIASSRYPDKFPSSAGAGEFEQAEALAQMTAMYCADPHMQKMLGRSPDDFNDELAAWADQAADDAICDCILELYGPMMEMMEMAKEVAEDVVDGMLSASNKKAYNLEREATLALDRMLDPIKQFLASGNMMADLGKALAKGLQDMAMSLVYAAVMIVIKYVKDEILGSLTADLCNSQGNAFNVTSPADWLMNSQIYKDKGEQQIWDKFGDLSAKHFFNVDIQNMIDGFGKIGDAFSVREMKRLFTTDCGDSSYDQQYSNCAKIFLPQDAKDYLHEQFPGASLAEIGALVGYDPTYSTQIYDIDGKTYDLSKGFISPGQMHDFLHDIGTLIDPNIYDDVIEQYDAILKQFSSFCEPGGLDELEKTIDPGDIQKLAEGDTEQLLNDIEKIFPLLDPEMMKNQYPPLFCGPCAPNQVGMKPLMDSQTHPSQLFMYERLNDHTYKIIDEVFNNNLSVYKPTLNEIGSMSIINEMINNLPAKLEDPTAVSEKYGEAFGKTLSFLGASPEYDDIPNKIVAKKFRDTLLSATDDTNAFGQLQSFDPENRTAIFKYVLANSSVELFLIINFSLDAIDFRGDNVGPSQIKFISYNAGVRGYVFPPGDEPMKDFDFESTAWQLFKYWTGASTDYYSKTINQKIGEWDPKELLDSLFPIATNLILETIWNNTTQNEFFLSKNFNSMPLTNQEAKSKCAETDITPLLDPEGLKRDIDDMRKALECVTSMFAKPDALQIANLLGLYKTLIKVSVVEELLKGLFLYSFAKIHDIIENPSYMAIVVDSVRSSVESVLSTGFDDLLKYSAKLINGRTQLMDESELEGLSESEKAEKIRTKTPKESLDILIVECAVEIDKLFDTRIREHVNPKWKNMYVSLDDMDPSKSEAYFGKNKYLQYGIRNEMMMDSRYPTRKYTAGGTINASSYALEAGKLPSFELVGLNFDALNHDPPIGEQAHKVLPLNTGGGLYFEPYIRVNSTLAIGDPMSMFEEGELFEAQTAQKMDPDNPDEKITMVVTSDLSKTQQAFFKLFWRKFKGAVQDWENATHRSDDDTMVEDAGAGILKGKIFNKDNSQALQKDVFYGPYTSADTGVNPRTSWPRGAGSAFHPKDSALVENAHSFLRSLVDKIDSEEQLHKVLVFERSDGSKSTFWEFFELFFSPLDENGQPWNIQTDPNVSSKYGLKAQSTVDVDHRSIFGSIVSSFRQKHISVGNYGANRYGSTKYNKGFDFTAGKNGWTDAFYYWQHYPNGVVPAAKIHFLNRGVINLNTFNKAYAIGGHAHSKWNNPAWTIKANVHGSFNSAMPSIIDLYANAKNSVFGIGNTHAIGNPSKWKEMTEEEIEAKKEEGVKPLITGFYTGSKFFNQVKNDENAEFMLTIQDFMIKHGANITAPDLTPEAGLYTQEMITKLINASVSKNAPAICSFYNWLKSVIIESRYDRWFDMSLGMRLNLVIPFEDPGETALTNEYIKNLVDSLLDTKDNPTDRAYNLDKIFLLSEPAVASSENEPDTRKWLCLPMETVEYDLLNYWSDMWGKYAGEESGQTFPGDATSKAIISAQNIQQSGKYSDGVPDSPWHTIMKGIATLGHGTIEDPGHGYKYNFCRGILSGVGAWATFYRNMYTPIILDESKIDDGTFTQYFYVSDISGENFNKPTLWSACRLIQTALENNQRTGDDTEMENPIRKEVLDRLKLELMKKVKDAEEENEILNEILPIKESVFTTAMMYRYSMESAYPSLINLFSPTKALINSFIAQLLKTVDGDYSYVNEALKETDPEEKINSSSPSPGDIAEQFFMLVVQMAANTIDPTWKTPWFMPGPLTPVGAIAKALSMDWSEDSGKKNKEALAEECSDQTEEGPEES